MRVQPQILLILFTLLGVSGCVVGVPIVDPLPAGGDSICGVGDVAASTVEPCDEWIGPSADCCNVCDNGVCPAYEYQVVGEDCYAALAATGEQVCNEIKKAACQPRFAPPLPEAPPSRFFPVPVKPVFSPQESMLAPMPAAGPCAW